MAEILNQLSDTDAAYLAGLIDGEGCISVTRTNTSKSAKGCKRGFSYRSSVAVTLTDKDVLVWCATITGIGSVVPKKSTGVLHKPAWCWAVWSNQAMELCRTLLPHLKIKWAQAQNLMAFQGRMRMPGKPGLTDAEWNYREECYSLSRHLNKRGTI